jgi:hypothetical protein
MVSGESGEETSGAGCLIVPVAAVVIMLALPWALRVAAFVGGLFERYFNWVGSL